MMRSALPRPVLVMALLALTSVFAAALTASAIIEARSHRAMAERVLHDYAALGAEGVAQRLKVGLSTRFSSVLLAAAALSDANGRAPSLTMLRRNLPASVQDVIDDSSAIMRAMRGDSLARALEQWTTGLPAFAYFGMRWQSTVNGRTLLIFQPVHASTSSAAAFTLSQPAVQALVGRMIARDPVLPASLLHGAASDQRIGLRVMSANQSLADRSFVATSPFQASIALGPPYADLAVDVSLDASLAPALIIGGLPQSQVPLFIALLVLTVGITIAAGYQLRRELELSRLREDFVSSVSHELRTPLAQIRMFAETLRLGRVRSSEEGDRSLEIIENEARRLEHLVENVLAISRAERRSLEVHPCQTNLTSLVQEIVGEFAPLAARSDSRIVLDVAPGIEASVDPSAIRQILLNLLDNAVKYGRRGQTIFVRLSSAGGGARLMVEDEGEGISVADRERIWDRFQRGAAAHQTGTAGAGVGLAIVRDLVRLHKGASYAGTTSNGGAALVIDLPGQVHRDGPSTG